MTVGENFEIASSQFTVDSSNGNTLIAGDLTVTGGATVGGAAVQTSDARWKTDVVNVTDALDTVQALRPVYYRWREDSPSGVHFRSRANTTVPAPTQLGFLAQEVRDAVAPSAAEAVVHEVDEEGHLGLDYGKLTALLVGAVQEQQRTIVQMQQALLEQHEAQRELRELVDDLLRSGR
jgi:hypothetical protein